MYIYICVCIYTKFTHETVSERTRNHAFAHARARVAATTFEQAARCLSGVQLILIKRDVGRERERRKTSEADIITRVLVFSPSSFSLVIYFSSFVRRLETTWRVAFPTCILCSRTHVGSTEVQKCRNHVTYCSSL